MLFSPSAWLPKPSCNLSALAFVPWRQHIRSCVSRRRLWKPARSPADAKPLFVYCLVIFLCSCLHLQSESLMAITCARGVAPQHMPVCDLSPSTSWHTSQPNIWLWLVPHFGSRFHFSHCLWKHWGPKMLSGSKPARAALEQGLSLAMKASREQLSATCIYKTLSV